jgi:hypothetical protein
MGDYDPKWESGVWYRVKVKPDGKWDTKRTGTLFFGVGLEVTGGHMAGRTLPLELFLQDTDESRGRFNTNCRLLGYDLEADLNEMEGKTTGIELWARCEIQEIPNKPGQFYPARANEIRDLNSRIPGGLASKAAAILRNTKTKPPDPDTFNDNY